jgi:hypothetical protein
MASKLMLSDDELLFLNQTKSFVLKAAITTKIYEFLGDIKKQFSHINEQSGYIFPEGTDIITGKISKGENYNGCPYFILDFPKLFSKENIFSFRVMLWWGNYWSVHLHLSGKSYEQYRDNIQNNMGKLNNEGFFLSNSDEEWNYEINETNYLPVSEKNISIINEKIAAQSSIRISSKTAIQSNLPESWILTQYSALINIVLH